MRKSNTLAKTAMVIGTLTLGAIFGSAATQYVSQSHAFNDTATMTEDQKDTIRIRMLSAYAKGETTFYGPSLETYGIRKDTGASPVLGIPTCDLRAVKAIGFDLDKNPVSFAKEPVADVRCP